MLFRSHASRAALVAAAAVAALVLTSCSTPTSDGGASGTQVPGVTDDTITIGTHTPLTGPAAPGYASVSAGALAYFAYVNDNGGVHGRKINYIVKDDGYNPANTQMVVRELVQDDGVFAIFNGLGTPPHTSVVDYLNDSDVPDLFVASGSTTWNQPEQYPNMFPFNRATSWRAQPSVSTQTMSFPAKPCAFSVKTTTSAAILASALRSRWGRTGSHTLRNTRRRMPT